MKISRQARSDAKALLRACRVNGVLDEGRVRDAVTRVIAAKPRGHAGILQHFSRLVKVDIERRTALVESATPVGPELATQLTANLAARHGVGLQLSFRVVPALIGGLRVRVGSTIYDGSVAGRLAALSEQF
jgi:F-type H+-transporting ATPase subunit delta